MKKILIFLAAGAILCFPLKNTQAALPPISSGADLNAQAERFQQEYSMEKRAREQAISKALMEYEAAAKAPVAPGPTFILRDIHLTGVTIVGPEHLSFIWKPFLGKRVNFKDINDIVRLINRVYQDLGFLTTEAYLPPQDIKGGVVEISVLEGKRGTLTVKGNRWFSTPSIEKYFHTYQGEVLDMGEVGKDLMRLNENKDLNVSSVFSPGQDPGTVDVTLKAKETVPYHVSVGTDNQGSDVTGRFRRLVSFDTSNLTGNEDSLYFNGAFTDLSQGYYLSYQTPVGTHGTKLGLGTGYFEGRLGKAFKPFDVNNYTQFYDPNAAFELYGTETTQINLRTGMQFIGVHKKQATDWITDENLRLPYVALVIIKTDSMGQTTFSPEIMTSAPGFLDASKADNARSSRPQTDGFFAKYAQYLMRNQAMPWGSYLQFRSQFQAAVHSLPTSQQLQLGGENSVRGYPEGDYLADIGGNLDTDWYFPAYFIPPSWESHGVNLRNDIQPFVFYDMGGGKLTKVYSGEHSAAFLSGVGAGVKIQIKKNMYLKLEWAVPTGNKPVSGAGPSTFDVVFQAST